MEHSLLFHLYHRSVRLKDRFNFHVTEECILSTCMLEWIIRLENHRFVITIKVTVTHQTFSVLQRCLQLHILDESQAAGFCLCFHFMGSTWIPELLSFSKIVLSTTEVPFPLFFFLLYLLLVHVNPSSAQSSCSDWHLQPVHSMFNLPCAWMTWLLSPVSPAPELLTSLCYLVFLLAPESHNKS